MHARFLRGSLYLLPRTSLTFLERFELSEYLKSNWNNWTIQSLKKLLLVKDRSKNIPVLMKMPTISDRSWLSLIKLALEPVHEALFHPNNYGFRSSKSIYEVQNAFLLNLSKDAFGYQKRILRVDLRETFLSFNRNYLIQKIRAPRSVKLGIFRLLEKGFDLKFPEESYLESTFDSLISNIFLDGIETIHNCVHYGYQLLFWLKPRDNEKTIVKNLNLFIYNSGLCINKLSFDITMASKGFNFLGWYFSLSTGSSANLYCYPSFDNYQLFIRRVKRIINNSSYGSIVKASKLYPIIKEWKLYHKYSNLTGSKYSLFFLKKRAFKAFNSESKQDFYSSKRLLDKCFSVSKTLNEYSQNPNMTNSSFYGHITFWIDFIPNLDNSIELLYNYKSHSCFCVHCGMKTY